MDKHKQKKTKENKEKSVFSGDYLTNQATEALTENRKNFSNTQKEAIRDALGGWAEIGNIKFTEVEDDELSAGVLRFGLSSGVNDFVGASSAFAFFSIRLFVWWRYMVKLQNCRCNGRKR